MIDSSDGDTFWLVSLLCGGPIAIIAFIFAVVLWCIAATNATNCRQLSCPVAMSAKLIDHECVCVGKPLMVPE